MRVPDGFRAGEIEFSAAPEISMYIKVLYESRRPRLNTG
jgi:hypothetical protein